MKLKRIVCVALLTTAMAFILGGCGDQKSTSDMKSTTPTTIRIGATAGPHAQIVEEVAKEAKKQNINIELVEFSDYITPDKALADGSLQLNAYQHVPFLQNFNKQNNSDLVPIETTVIMRMGIYSNKIHDIKDVPDKATISIPNDPTNGGRALQLLQQAGLITLKNDVGFKATLADITSNPKELQFKELEAAQLPRSLDDVDMSVITMNYVMSAGLDVKKQGVFFEDKNNPLAVIVLAVQKKDIDNETYKKIGEIYHSQAIKNFIEKTFKGTIEVAEPLKDK